MRKLYLPGLIIISLIMTKCQSLEDTYSDYAGDHVIRYVGKCSELTVTPGWQRLNVEWTNSVDPAIEKIKLTWSADGRTSDTLLLPGTTACNLTDMEDGAYEVTVCGMDKEGNTSLPMTAYARPYTYNHELVRIFTHGITKCMPVKNNLMLFFDTWQDNIAKLEIHYTNTAGEKQVFPITREVCASKYTLLEDVDIQQEVSVEREGYIGDCPDLIVFEPLNLLDRAPSFTTDFTTLALRKYGIQEMTDAFINQLEELEIDYSVTSLEDILYFPNLKKLTLGKNRYLYLPYLDMNCASSTIAEMQKSLFILDIAHKWLDLEVERYNQHYFPDITLDYMAEKGNPELPVLNYLDATEWEITNSVEDNKEFDSHLENLLDNDVDTYWETQLQPEARLYDIDIDMKSLQTVRGLKIVQRNFHPSMSSYISSLLPGNIRILVSEDKITWEMPMYVEDNVVGNTNGEITLLQFPVPKHVRYIRLQLSDQMYNTTFGITLADIAVF